MFCLTFSVDLTMDTAYNRLVSEVAYLRKILSLCFAAMLAFSLAACAVDTENNGSQVNTSEAVSNVGTVSNQSAASEGQNSSSAGQKSSSVGQTTSKNPEGTDQIVDQLEELESILSGLDDISSGDLVIPES